MSNPTSDINTAAAPQPTPQERRDNLRRMVKDGFVSLSLAADMIRDDPALGSLNVMPLLRACTGATVSQARYALAVAGLNGKTQMRDIDASTADVLTVSAIEAFDTAPRTLHFPFWDEPPTENT